LRLRPVAGTPWGAVFLGVGVLAGGLVALVPLDRLPIALCLFKQLTGLPCPSCGSTRALGRLAQFDVWGALSMNPLFVVAAFGLLAWGLAELALWARGRALDVAASPGALRALRLAALAAVGLNWAYLIAFGR
jgi:hypothetical protein